MNSHSSNRLRLRVRPSLLILAMNTATTWFGGLFAPTKEILIAIGSCWVVFGIYTWFRLIRTGHKGIAAIPVFFVVAICVGVSLPIETFNSLLEPANGFLRQIGSPLAIGKIGHVFCFAMLTLFALRVRRSFDADALELVLFLALLAVATEGIQLFVSGRTSSVVDLGLDTLGAALGLGLYLIYKKFGGGAEFPQPPDQLAS